MKKITLLLIFCLITSIFFWMKNEKNNIYGHLPVPTEFDLKKSKKKDFKIKRKQFFKRMHRSHPDDNWEEMDLISKNKRIEKVLELRQNIISKKMNQSYKPIEKISNNLMGYWQERGSNNLAGRILTADIDWQNNLIYCASDGGNIWRGNMNGENWTSLNDYMQIKGIHFLRIIQTDIDKKILIANSDNFYFSENEGQTIEMSNGLSFLSQWDGNYIKRVIITNENIIYLLANEGTGNWNAMATIYKSTDYGKNFSKIINLDTISNQDVNHFDIWTNRYMQSAIYLIHDNQFYKLNNLDELEFISNIPTSNNDENILTGGMGSNYPFFYAHIGGEIYQSINNGNSWINRGERPQWYFNLQNSFNSSNLNRDLIFWGGMEVFKSNNGASSWTLINNWWEYYGNESNKLHADIPEIRFFLDSDFNEVALISTDGGLYISYDNLETVQNISMNGLGVSQYYSTYTKRTFPYHTYAGSQDQGFQRSTNPNNEIYNFIQSISGDYGHLCSGDNGETIWSNYPGFTLYYSNPETGTGSLSLDFPGSGHLWLAPLVEDPYNPNQAYLGGGGITGGNHIFHLTANNSSINFQELPFNFNSTVTAMSYSKTNYQYRYVLTYYGNFYHSNDNGNSWELSDSFNGPNAHYFYGSSIWSSVANPNKLIIGGSGYSNPPVYVSYNNGITFNELSEGLPNTLVYDLSGTPDDKYFFAATEIGPYVYIAEENLWTDLSGVSAPDQTYWSVEYIPELKTARFGTYGRGIWDFIIEDSILLGDVNFDQLLNIQDLILMINFILSIEIANQQEFVMADINGDYILDILDIISIVNLILNP